jgi:hypothetical protein
MIALSLGQRLQFHSSNRAAAANSESVSAAFSYPRAKASTSFPAVLNLLKRSKLIELNC